MQLKRPIFTLLALALVLFASATEPPGPKGKQKNKAQKSLAEGCAPATAQADLNINNVRARILNGGDMWWDLNRAQYEVPKGSNKHSMFAGALWLGGIDEADQLKLAAMTYRQDGVDYWPGPLDEEASVTEETCQNYDQQWVVYREEVETHKAWIDCKEDPSCDPAVTFPGYAANIPNSIVEWPGNGIDGNRPNMLAPYNESDSNGIPGFYDYEWDYPAYDLSGTADCQARDADFLYGDQTIWWVYNDKGNIHTESNGAALGFEIRAQAFAFTSNDEVNNMTFNSYRILNKSSFRLEDTYFGTWFDPDLGNPFDDIIGSDIARGLGFVYNGDNNDEGALGYGLNPPAIGFDFFQGPFADYFNGLDDDRDGCVDGVRIDGECQPEDPSIGRNERIIMSGFMYYNNAFNFSGPDGTTDPDNAQEFYRLLRSIWKDGRPLVVENPSGPGNTSNGDGYVLDPSGYEVTKFAYPGSTYDSTGTYEPSSERDPGWYESPENSADKRGLHTAGPFSLAPGALNFITTGNVWARNFTSGNLFASVNDVIVADDKAQQLFDNCFQVLDGPSAPNLEIVELDRELVINFLNPFAEDVAQYQQRDPIIPPRPNWSPAQIDSAEKEGYFDFKFEGFQVFQVSGPDVGVDELYDPAQSRLIFQSDLENDVGQLVNYESSPDLEDNPLTPMDMTLKANNSGVEVSYHVTQDAFSEGEDLGLINHREYYFYVVAYAQNNYIPFDPAKGDDQDAQKTPFLAGRRNIGNNSKPYVGIPSKVSSRNGGTVLNSNWGDVAEITRLAGAGNGGNFLSIAQETEDQIVSNFFQEEIKYSRDNGPVEVKVVDPYKVRSGSYRLEFTGVGPQDRWKLYNEQGELIDSLRRDLAFEGEQIVKDVRSAKGPGDRNYGFSIKVTNPRTPGYQDAENNGIVGGNITFADPTKNWLSGVPDNDAEAPTNWILAGANNISDGDNTPTVYYNDYTTGLDTNVDVQGRFEGILSGTWAPFPLVSNVPAQGQGTGDDSPGFPLRDPTSKSISNLYDIEELPNIDVVITKDPGKWTRVPVLEMGNISANNIGRAELFELRQSPSLNLQNGQLVEDPSSTGWSYFPGYAINVETGRRLNIIMGENSWLKSENGDDMLFNPTANLTQKLGRTALGGMHTIYVMRGDTATVRNNVIDMSYQGDAIEDYPIKDLLEGMGSQSRRLSVWSTLTWASIGLLTEDRFTYDTYADIPTDVKVELRVQNPFESLDYGPNGGNPVYTFDLDGLAPVIGDREVANDALDDIRVVPNPYYGSSRYENSQLDNVVKITNLPERCEIKIFMPNGTLVRTIRKDNKLTYAEWDLKNNFNVPIASGIYIIHIDAGAIGQTTVKWVGSLRPTDLNAF